MSSLRDQINKAEGEIRDLLAGKVVLTVIEGHLLVFLQEKLASLRGLQLVEAQSVRDLRLAEAQRGEMLVSLLPLCWTSSISMSKYISPYIYFAPLTDLLLPSYNFTEPVGAAEDIGGRP